MNYELIIACVSVAVSIAVPLGLAITNTGKRLTEFMAQMEVRVANLEKAENTVCKRLDDMEARQSKRHEGLQESITQLREELIASNSIKPGK
jgi:hypothetical protein